MRLIYKSAILVAIAGFIAPAAMLAKSRGSDHADTPAIAANPGTDLTDVYLFPSATDPSKVVLSMSVHPLIMPGHGLTTAFDPNVLYQFKIDNTGDAVEDLVIQARFSGSDPATQRVMISYPEIPSTHGAMNNQEAMLPITGSLNSSFSPTPGMSVFAGGREDSFFFDLEQFFTIFPDRAAPLTGVEPSNPNQPQATSWRAPGQAVDFLSNGQYNVLSIVVELPRKWLINRGGPPGSKKSNIVHLWCTTAVPSGNSWKQMDRLARPAVNEVFATVANNRHKINDEDGPANDQFQLKGDIDYFMTNVAGRSRAITNVVEAVLVPDMISADLSSSDPASYLGYETGGATGGKFGGRALHDDIVDLSLGVIFGNTIPALGLAPDDGHEIPSLTSDNVTDAGKHFLADFPYLGDSR
jgi:hypothetical protein